MSANLCETPLGLCSGTQNVCFIPFGYVSQMKDGCVAASVVIPLAQGTDTFTAELQIPPLLMAPLSVLCSSLQRKIDLIFSLILLENGDYGFENPDLTELFLQFYVIKLPEYQRCKVKHLNYQMYYLRCLVKSDWQNL